MFLMSPHREISVVAANAWGSGLRLVSPIVADDASSEAINVGAHELLPVPVSGGSPLPMMMGLSHRAASTNEKSLTHWEPPTRSADGHILPEKRRIDARTSDLVRNNGFAHGIVQTQKDNIVGPRGLFLSCEPDAKALGWSDEQAEEWAEQVESEFATWRKDPREFDYRGVCDGVDAAEMAFYGSFSYGDHFAIPMWVDEPNRRWKTRILSVESNRVRNPVGQGDNKWFRRGVQLDDRGRPIFIHVTKESPDDVLLGGYGYNSYETTAVPIETQWGRKQAIQLIARQEAGQNRGVGALYPIIADFKNLDIQLTNQQANQILQNFIGMVIETPMGEDLMGLFGGNAQVASTELNARTAPRFRGGGGVLQLKPGERAIPFAPNLPGLQLEQSLSMLMHAIHAATGMPRELIERDFSKSSYVGIRAGLAEAARVFTGKRYWIATGWEQHLYELALEEMVTDGRIKAPNFYKLKPFYCRAEWIGAGMSYTDRLKEENASAVALENNLTTLKFEHALRGNDWRKVLKQRKKEKDVCAEYGLPFLPGPATIAASGAANNPANDVANDARPPQVPPKGN
jgi:lambda family phage portal protein